MGKPLVLVVDDDEGFQQSVSDVIGDRYDTICVGSTLETRAALLRHPVDAIFLDWQLRGETSQGLLDELGASPSCPPVVVLSGNTVAKDAAKRYGLPWVAKPFDTDVLLTTLASALLQGTRPHRLHP